MRSIEIVFDEQSEQALRRRWEALVAADLPSLALHTSPTNRPHITLAAGASLLPVRLPHPVPTTIRFGGLTLFPAAGDRWVLVEAVVLDGVLAAFHRALHTALPDAEPTSLPGLWTPHATISRRLTPERVGQALEALRSVPQPETATVAEVRYWNGDTKEVTSLT